MLEIIPKLTPKAIARFWDKVDKSGDCWVWTSSVDGGGYGTFSLHGKYGSPAKAHRVSFAINFSEPREGFEICHKCDNPRCVNPSHLFEASHHDNLKDAAAKNRMSRSNGKKGSLQCMAKLTETDLPEIRELLRAGVTKTKIGIRFGVNRTTITKIQNRKTWTHA